MPYTGLCDRLRTLYLWNMSNKSNHIIAHAVQKTRQSLQALLLSGDNKNTLVIDRSMVGKCANLTSVTFVRCYLRVDAFKALASCPKLETIAIRRCKFWTAHERHDVGVFRTLRTLLIGEVTREEQISHVGAVFRALLSSLETCQTLEHVSVVSCAMTDSFFAALHRLPSLVSIQVADCDLYDAGMKGLSGCPVLRTVCMIDSRPGNMYTRCRWNQGTCGSLLTYLCNSPTIEFVQLAGTARPHLRYMVGRAGQTVTIHNQQAAHYRVEGCDDCATCHAFHHNLDGCKQQHSWEKKKLSLSIWPPCEETLGEIKDDGSGSAVEKHNWNLTEATSIGSHRWPCSECSAFRVDWHDCACR